MNSQLDFGDLSLETDDINMEIDTIPPLEHSIPHHHPPLSPSPPKEAENTLFLENSTQFTSLINTMESVTTQKDAILSSLDTADATLRALSSAIAFGSSLNTLQGLHFYMTPVTVLTGVVAIVKLVLENASPLVLDGNGAWGLTIICIPSSPSTTSSSLDDETHLHHHCKKRNMHRTTNTKKNLHTYLALPRIDPHTSWSHMLQLPIDMDVLPCTLAVLLCCTRSCTAPSSPSLNPSIDKDDFINMHRTMPPPLLLHTMRIDSLYALHAANSYLHREISHHHHHLPSRSSTSASPSRRLVSLRMRLAVPKAIFGLYPSPHDILYEMLHQNISSLNISHASGTMKNEHTSDVYTSTSRNLRKWQGADDIIDNLMTSLLLDGSQARASTPGWGHGPSPYSSNSQNEINKKHASLKTHLDNDDNNDSAYIEVHVSAVQSSKESHSMRRMYSGSAARHAMMDITCKATSLSNAVALHEDVVCRIRSMQRSLTWNDDVCLDGVSFPDGTFIAATAQQIPLVDIAVLDDMKERLKVLKERVDRLKNSMRDSVGDLGKEIGDVVLDVRDVSGTVPVLLI